MPLLRRDTLRAITHCDPLLASSPRRRLQPRSELRALGGRSKCRASAVVLPGVKKPSQPPALEESHNFTPPPCSSISPACLPPVRASASASRKGPQVSLLKKVLGQPLTEPPSLPRSRWGSLAVPLPVPLYCPCPQASQAPSQAQSSPRPSSRNAVPQRGRQPSACILSLPGLGLGLGRGEHASPDDVARTELWDR